MRSRWTCLWTRSLLSHLTRTNLHGIQIKPFRPCWSIATGLNLPASCRGSRSKTSADFRSWHIRCREDFNPGVCCPGSWCNHCSTWNDALEAWSGVPLRSVCWRLIEEPTPRRRDDAGATSGFRDMDESSRAARLAAAAPEVHEL